jgi:hypothetical protein
MSKKSVTLVSAVASLVAAMALGASAASADATLVPGLTFTGLSGATGSSTTEIGAASDVNAVSFISWGERFDSPCWLRAYKAEINGANTSLVDDFNHCVTTGPNKTVGWLNNSGIFVHGVAVCTNASSNRLKGIQLFGGVFAADGSFIPLLLPMITEHTNCNTWHAAVLCPAGQVATKVRVHHTGDEIRGLSLGCRASTEL